MSMNKAIAMSTMLQTLSLLTQDVRSRKWCPKATFHNCWHYWTPTQNFEQNSCLTEIVIMINLTTAILVIWWTWWTS